MHKESSLSTTGTAKLGIREIVLVGLFTGLTCIVAFIMKWGGAVLVPFSLLPLMSFLAGALLGGRLGALSMLVYVLMGLVGIPVFATEPFGGPIYVLKPTFGFLLGFIASAYATGKIVEKKAEPSIRRYVAAMLVGLGLINIIGLPYIWLACNFWAGAIMQYLAVTVSALSLATIVKVFFLPFVGFDLIKVGFGAFLAHLITRRIGGVIHRPGK